MKTTLTTLGVLTTGLIAGPINFQQIPAAAHWYLHADVDKAKQTEVGNQIREIIKFSDTILFNGTPWFISGICISE